MNYVLSWAMFNECSEFQSLRSEGSGGVVLFENHSGPFFPVPDSPPRSIDIHAVSSHVVQVKWKPPPRSDRNGEILQFEVRYYEKGAREETETSLNTSVTSIDVKGLKERTYYAFMVRAWTSAGAGHWTNQVFYKTDKSCEPPFPPQSALWN